MRAKKPSFYSLLKDADIYPTPVYLTKQHHDYLKKLAFNSNISISESIKRALRQVYRLDLLDEKELNK